MKREGKKRGRRCLAGLLCMLMLLPSNFGFAVAAGAEDTGLCEHHTAHTAECGYVAAVEGQPCTHVHDDTCGYAAAVPETPCDKGCTDTDGDGVIDHTADCAYKAAVAEQPCQHEHDESCGYVEAVAGSSCKYVCEICSPVQDEENPDDGENPEDGDTAPVSEVTISTTMGNVGYVGVEYDLLSGVTVSPDRDENENPILVRIKDITSTDTSYFWDGTTTTLTPQKGGTVYTIVYEAYAEIDGTDFAYATYDFTLNIWGDSEIGKKLDGDYAYISEACLLQDSATDSGYAIRTGSAPWDDDDEAGNDSCDTNSTVRSFDIVSYTVGFRSKVREVAPYKAYETGTLHFEFVLPGDSSQVQFETGSMGWLSAKKDVAYTVTEESYDGQTYQVLRGSFLWEPNDENPAAIGESYQELGLVTRVLAMKQGETVQPKFTFWLDGNEVPTEGLVTDSNSSCEAHGEAEYKTITGPAVTVSSAPRFNLRIVNGAANVNQALGSFDFSTGNDLAANKGAGVKTGRVQAFGAVLQIVGKSAEHGLRGCELPDGNSITFDLTLTGSYLKETGGSVTPSADYAPLLWSIDGNADGSTQADGRSLSMVQSHTSYYVPLNAGGGYRSCYQGGTWTGTQEGNTIHVTVSDYEVDPTSRVYKFPYRNYGSSANAYYTPDAISGYWDIQTACFSAGEIWVVQPFYDKDGTYIVDEYSAEGTFQITLTDQKLRMTGASGTGLETVDDNSNQAVQTDDKPTQASYLAKPGYIQIYIGYDKYDTIFTHLGGLTEGCYSNGKDWISNGGSLGILGEMIQDEAEGQNRLVAADYLIKFDDAFFELESCLTYASGDNVLYGAKPDRSGWDHLGKKPDEAGYDAEMMRATADDLIFFSSLEELQSAGYTCVAVLSEIRRNFNGGYFTSDLKLLGHTKKDPGLNGSVFMVTHSAVAWSRQTVAEAAAAYCSKSVTELTDDDYLNYTQNALPSRAGQKTLTYAEDYPEATNTWDYNTTPGLKNYTKAQYDESGYVTGTAGRVAGDSCLVVGYATRITKDTKQSVLGTGLSKVAYDLDVGQRIADFVLNPSAVRTAGESLTQDARITTDIYIEDTLPKGLTYIPNSSRWGGTYTQTAEGKQGVITGGEALEPEVTANEDGTTTLRWTLKNVVVTENEVTYFDPIYYSCDIGTPGVEETDVHNNQQLLNTAIIWSKDEQKRDFNDVNNNKADKSILVSKNYAVSLSKTSDQAVVDVGEGMGFTLNVGNNSNNDMGVIVLDSLPYVGDAAGSSFTGACQVTEFTVTSTALLEKFQLYYTTDEAERGKSSGDYTTEAFSNTAVWKTLTADTDGKVELPEDFAPVAVAAVGTLPGSQTLKMHMTLLLPEGQPGDYVANRLTRGNLESFGRSYVVSRTLEGVVWLDANANGLRADSETRLDGVTATLMKLKDGGNAANLADYEAYTTAGGQPAAVQTGLQMDLSSGEVTAYDTGGYRFTNLPAGTFGVLFSDGTVELAGYVASPADQGNDDTIDSDATGVYTADEVLEKAFIANILMPDKRQITTLVYVSRNHDMGLYVPAELRFTKVKAENTSEGLSGAEFRLYLLTCTDSGHTHGDLIDPANPTSCWTLKDTQTSDPEVAFSGLLPGEYRLVETKAPKGRALPAGQWRVSVGDGSDITITAVGTTQPPAFAVGADGERLLPNMRPADVPSSGGMGTIPFMVLGVLLMGGGLLISFYPRKRGRKGRNARAV